MLSWPASGWALEPVPGDYQVLPPAPLAGDQAPAGVRGQVAAVWAAQALGEDKAALVDTADPLWSGTLWRDNAGVALTPASTTKLLTATAVLKAFGPDHRFRTVVRQSGSTIHLVGGGDPQLATGRTGRSVNANASLTYLARDTADALRASGRSEVSLRFDDSLFGPPYEQPFWKPDFLTIGVVAPIMALSADGGRSNPAYGGRSPDPAATAARSFARLLSDNGIDIVGGVSRGTATGKRIASVQSPPLSNLVEHLLLTSDNTEAETLAHQAGLELTGQGTFAGGAAATLEVLEDLDVDTAALVLNDGSGLSRGNRISPRTLVSVLHTAIADDSAELWPVLTGLPVAGFDGSLQNRFATGPARAGRGAVTGKTGTLTGVSSLAGLAQARDGSLLVYALMANRVPSVFAASAAIDETSAGLAACGCSQGE